MARNGAPLLGGGHPGNGEAKVSAERVDDHRAAVVGDGEAVDEHGVVDRVGDDLEERHDDEL